MEYLEMLSSFDNVHFACLVLLIWLLVGAWVVMDNQRHASSVMRYIMAIWQILFTVIGVVSGIVMIALLFWATVTLYIVVFSWLQVPRI